MRPRLGMVLSGGGSRGLAHAGVLEALREAGIAPDCIAGTSAGALVGALHLAGYDAPRILDFFARTSPFRISNLAPFGRPGWVDTEKIAADFAAYFPDDSFAALRGRLFVTATDLVEARLRVFTSGPLIRPLLASASIPMVFTPTAFEGTLYADGGILDNFPTRPLAGLCRALLGVYASPLRTAEKGTLVNSFAVTQRALEIGMFHAAQRKFRHLDLVLCPPELERYALFDLRRHAEILDVGYRAARARMDEIVRLVERADSAA